MDRRPREQVEGAVEQAEGKLQNAWGNAKDEAKKAAEKGTNKTNEPFDDSAETEDEIDVRSRRKVS